MLPLPASLRINFDCPYADRLKEELLQFCSPSESSETGAVKALSWFPDGRAFQLELDRTTIRKVTNTYIVFLFLQHSLFFYPC